MRIMALIDDSAVIERILKHLKVWDPGPSGVWGQRKIDLWSVSFSNRALMSSNQ
jgi:hypothetical protein